MLTVNRNNILLQLCLLITVVLCLGHVTNNMLIVVAAMVMFMFTIVSTSMSGKALYVLCFFIPWAPLIKFQPGTMSLYSVGLIAVCLFTWIRHRVALQKHVLWAIPLIVLMFTVKMYFGFGMDNSFILFSILLVLFPVMGLDISKTYDFYELTLFFSLGIIGAALSAYFLVEYSTIARFIDVYSYREVTRYSGYYGDANFYSAHISAALAGLLVIFVRYRKKMWTSIILSVVLLYCGMLSASKSFVISICVVFLLWIIHILQIRSGMSHKLLIIFIIMAIAIAIIFSDIFSALFKVIAIRFGNVSNIHDLTTGRNDIWADYLKYFAESPETLFFGKGFTNIMVDGRASHNTLLQIVYQFGLVGTPFFVMWLKWLFKIALKNLKINWDNFLSCLIVFSGVFIPWMGIDMLFFDEFFLLMFYVSLGFIWICNKPEGKETDLKSGNVLSDVPNQTEK